MKQQVAFMQKMVLDMKNFENINTFEEAISECVNMAMYEDASILP
jgi:RNAse (barnase) inhibitor barstar